MATAELTVTANLAGLRDELSKIPGITADSATEMVAELNKSIKASEKAAKQAANATKKAMDDTRQSAKAAAVATADVGEKFGRVGSDAGKLAGALGLVNPALGEAARTVADLADVGEVGAGAMAGLGTAVAAGAAVLGVFAAGMMPVVEAIDLEAQRAEEAARALTAYTQATEQAAQAQSALAGSLGSALDQIKIATGLETSREQSARRQADALIAQAAATAEVTQAEIDKADALIKSSKAELASYELKVRTGAITEEEAQTYRELQRSVAAATSEQTRNRAIVQQTTADAAALGETLIDLAKAEDQAERNAQRRAKAERLAADAAREAAQAEREREQSRAAYTKAVIDYAAGMERLTVNQSSFLSQEEKVVAAGEQRIKQLRELTQQVEYLGLTESEAAAARAAGAQAILDVEADVQAQLAQIRQEARDAEAAKATEAREAEAAAALENAQLIAQGIGAVGQGLDSIASNSASTLGDLQEQLASQSETLTMTEKKALEERVQAQRAAAIRAFEVAKAAKLAEAIINTAAAVASSLPNFVAAGAAAAVGGAQVATIAAQQPAFHSGGIVGAPPDEVNARLVRGEGVLSRSGVNAIGGEQAVRAANAGIPQTPQPMVIVQQYRHRVYNDFIKQNLRMGSPLAAEIRGTRTVGMREAL